MAALNKMAEIHSVVALNRLVGECRKDSNCGQKWTQLSKFLQDVGKMQNLPEAYRGWNALIDQLWVVSSSPGGSVGLLALGLLCKACSSEDNSRIRVRIRRALWDNLWAVQVVARYLNSWVSSTDHAKAAEVLEVLRHISHGVRIDRRDSYLYYLVPRLIEYMKGGDEKLVRLSSSVLASLCHRNYEVITLTLGLLSDDDRKWLFTFTSDDPIVRVMMAKLNHNLGSVNIFSSLGASEHHRLGGRDGASCFLAGMWKAMCNAYENEDSLYMEIIADFLKDLGEEDDDPGRRREAISRAVSLAQFQQLFAILDCSNEGSNNNNSGFANEMAFRFIRRAIGFYPDCHSLVDVVVKALIPRLESWGSSTTSSSSEASPTEIVIQPSSNGSSSLSSVARSRLAKYSGGRFIIIEEAILLLEAVVSGLGEQVQQQQQHNKNDDGLLLRHVQIQSDRLQIDQLVPTLCRVALGSASSQLPAPVPAQIPSQVPSQVPAQVPPPPDLRSMAAALGALTSICRVQADGWKDMVLLHLKPCSSKLVEGVKNSLMAFSYLRVEESGDQECPVPVLFKMVELCRVLEPAGDEAWSVVLQEPLLLRAVLECFYSRHLCHQNASLKVSAGVLIGEALKREASRPREGQIKAGGDGGPRLSGGGGALGRWPPHDHNLHMRVEEVMTKVLQATENMTLSDNLGDLLELNEHLKLSQQRQMDALASSLEAAQQQVANGNLTITLLKDDNAKLTGATARLLRQCQVSERRVADIKEQYESSQREAKLAMQKLDEEIESMSIANDNLEAEIKMMMQKVAEYKEQAKCLDLAILEHQKVQADLQEKLDRETRTNAELTSSLEKRDDKLKKKDRKLEEAKEERQRLEKELETLRKDNASLQAITKSQEQAITKKDKQILEVTEEIETMRQIQDQIYNLSRLNPTKPNQSR